MNPNLTELVYIIDRSGSMSHLTAETVSGYNAFLADQKKLEGEARLTTVLFDDKYELFCDHEDIQTAKKMTTQDCAARGFTALMDAIGRTINSIGKRLAATPEDERPSKVLFMIITDGYENASKEFTRSAIKSMIEHQQTVYSWEFLFVGAGIDAYAEANSIGISSDHTASTYATMDCMVDTMNAFSFAAGELRTCACSGGGGGGISKGWKKDISENIAGASAVKIDNLASSVDFANLIADVNQSTAKS